MSVERGAPPRRADVLRVLAEHRDELAAMGVTSLAVFGSVARDEARPDSDVDLLVEFDPARSIGELQFLELERRLAAMIGAPVDLSVPDALKPGMRDRILGEAVRAL